MSGVGHGETRNPPGHFAINDELDVALCDLALAVERLAFASVDTADMNLCLSIGDSREVRFATSSRSNIRIKSGSDGRLKKSRVIFTVSIVVPRFIR